MKNGIIMAPPLPCLYPNSPEDVINKSHVVKDNAKVPNVLEDITRNVFVPCRNEDKPNQTDNDGKESYPEDKGLHLIVDNNTPTLVFIYYGKVTRDDGKEVERNEDGSNVEKDDVQVHEGKFC